MSSFQKNTLFSQSTIHAESVLYVPLLSFKYLIKQFSRLVSAVSLFVFDFAQSNHMSRVLVEKKNSPVQVI